jgi:hypothetical protein
MGRNILSTDEFIFDLAFYLDDDGRVEVAIYFGMPALLL